MSPTESNSDIPMDLSGMNPDAALEVLLKQAESRRRTQAEESSLHSAPGGATPPSQAQAELAGGGAHREAVLAAEAGQCHPRGCAYPGRITDASMLPASDSPLAPAAAAEADQCHPRGCAYPGRIADSDMLPAADQVPEALNMGRGSSVQNFCAQGQASSGHASSSWQKGPKLW